MRNPFHLISKKTVQAPEFAFCETVTAGPLTPNHIRRLDEAGLKFGGGATTAALCGRDLNGGWDLPSEVSIERVAQLSAPRTGDGRVFVCTPCAEVFSQLQ